MNMNLQFKTLSECIEFFGRGNLVAIDNIRQIIHYISKAKVQPKFVCENETKSGKLTCWFLKSETYDAYKSWQESNPKKAKKDVK